MSADNPKPNTPQPCPICSETRGLVEHLIEVSLAADYHGNTSIYESEYGVAKIKTETIGAWLRLAAQLEKVKVNTWKFESSDAGFYCGTVADKYYAWRSRSGCTFCFSHQKIEWVRLKDKHPQAYEAAKVLEKDALEHGFQGGVPFRHGAARARSRDRRGIRNPPRAPAQKYPH